MRMQRVLSISALAALVLGLCASSDAALRRPARAGSFVRYSVQTVDDLVGQIVTDPTVAARYAQHFNTSPDKLATYFRDNLQVITLKAPIKVRTYFISKHGKIASKQRVLSAGRQVFATLGGDLLVETDCGNPVTRTLPPVKTKVRGTTSVLPPEAAPTEEMIPPAASVGPEIVEVPEEVTARAVEVAFEPVTDGLSAPSFMQIAEAVVPALAGLQFVHTRKAAPPEPIPEPGSLVSLSLACTGLASAQIVRRRRAAVKLTP
ncbi:MAG: hypothetical protein ACP5R5_00595 [Armatimonadota bacterium]